MRAIEAITVSWARSSSVKSCASSFFAELHKGVALIDGPRNFPSLTAPLRRPNGYYIASHNPIFPGNMPTRGTVNLIGIKLSREIGLFRKGQAAYIYRRRI